MPYTFRSVWIVFINLYRLNAFQKTQHGLVEKEDIFGTALMVVTYASYLDRGVYSFHPAYRVMSELVSPSSKIQQGSAPEPLQIHP